MSGTHAPQSRYFWTVLTGCLVLGAAASMYAGQDAFWDTRNYHLYNAWAWLTDRYGKDITPAGMQSYFNPLADIPYFLLGTGPLAHAPRWLAALQGLAFGLLCFVMWRIAVRLAAAQRRPFGIGDAAAVLIGISGTMAVSQLGSTTQEISLAVLVLGSLCLLLPTPPDASPGNRAGVRTLIAGLCAGLAAGLKPTAIVYGPALAVALMCAQGISRRSIKNLFLFTLGAGVGFFVAYGWWGLHLWQTTGNPVFPMFNHLFHSGLTSPEEGTDGQFRPRTVWQWLFYPFYWAGKNKGVVTEPPFADPRLAVAMAALCAMALFRIAARKRTAFATQAPEGAAAARALVGFAVVAYVGWLGLFSILRYAVPLEAVTGLLILLALRSLGGAWLARKAWREPFAMALAFVAIATSTSYPGWGRTPYADRVFAIDVPAVEPGSLVLFAGSPVGYLAPFFPHADQLEFIGIARFTARSHGYGLWHQMAQRIRDHKGPIYVVRRTGAEYAEEWALLNELTGGRALEDCRPIRSNLESGKSGKDRSMGLSLCRLGPDANG